MSNLEPLRVERDGIILYTFNKQETEEIWNEVFIQEQYRHSTGRDPQVIMDFGAHIGISVIYFKRMFPISTVVAVEPNPLSYKLLLRNIEINDLKGVIPMNCAVSNFTGRTRLFFDTERETAWSWGDSIVPNIWGDENKSGSIEVQTKRFADIMNELHLDHIDLLKMDIEGTEYLVLKDFQEKLNQIDEIFLEFHHTRNNSQNSIDGLLELLTQNFSNIKLVDYYQYFPDSKVDINLLKCAEKVVVGITASK